MKRLTTVRIWLSMMKIRGKTQQSSESVLFDPLIHVLAPIDIVLMHMTHVYSRRCSCCPCSNELDRFLPSTL